MEQTFVYFQPENINKFRCDGQSCQGHCCKYWGIDIDKATYKKYTAIKPKSKAQEITQKIQFNEEKKQYLVQLNGNHFCPFLTEDNWCKIQRKYGADFLSNTCMTYPRKTFRIGDFYERSLSLTCPVAADLILNSTDPMIFEQTEVSEKEYFNSCRDMVRMTDIPADLLKYVFNVQYAAISILQERSLTIDQRLIVVGYFCDQLEDLISSNKNQDIETLSLIYTSEDFIKTQVPQLIKSIEFNVRDFIRIMFDIFVMLYGDSNYRKLDAQVYLNYIAKALEVKVDKDGTASIDELVKNYSKHNSINDELMTKYAHILENYLVHEFFYCLYPWHVKGSVTFNYIIYLLTYKILEFIIFSMFVVKSSITSKEIIKCISWFVERIDHNSTYIDSISKGLQKDQDIVGVMRSLLKG